MACIAEPYGSAVAAGVERENREPDDDGRAVVDASRPGSESVNAPVELRHEAGLTAGQTLPLRPGRFRFGPLRSNHGGLVTGTPEIVSFELEIDDQGDTVLAAGREPVAVEGIVIDRPVTLDQGDVVQLTTDHFVLEAPGAGGRRRPTRSIEPRHVPEVEPARMTGWLLASALVIVVGLLLTLVNPRLVGISLFGLAGLIATLLVRSRRADQAQQARSVAVANARSLVFNEVLDARKAAADALRAEAPTPATVARQARHGHARSNERLLVTIASGDRAWEPPVVVRRSPGWDYRSIVDELSFLPAIPFTVELDDGPIAIVGPRSATLAVARHIVTTAMTVSGPGVGAVIETEVPADWRWLIDRRPASVRILDHVAGPLGPRTVVLLDEVDDLERVGLARNLFQAMMIIDESGRATISSGNEGGTGFVPHGITDQHARDLQQLLASDDEIDVHDLVPLAEVEVAEPDFVVDRSNVFDLEVFDTDRLLVTGPDRLRNKNVLATAALRQAGLHPNRTLYILDRGDRALIRLAQLDTCVRYVTLDQLDRVAQVINELDQLTRSEPAEPVLLLAPDLWHTISFYRASGAGRLADRIDEVIAKMEIVPVAASATSADALPSASFLVWIDTSVGETAHVRRPTDSGVIDLDSLPGIDLTGSVARFTTLPKQEIKP